MIPAKFCALLNKIFTAVKFPTTRQRSLSSVTEAQLLPHSHQLTLSATLQSGWADAMSRPSDPTTSFPSGSGSIPLSVFSTSTNKLAGFSFHGASLLLSQAGLNTSFMWISKKFVRLRHGKKDNLKKNEFISPTAMQSLNPYRSF